MADDGAVVPEHLVQYDTREDLDDEDLDDVNDAEAALPEDLTVTGSLGQESKQFPVGSGFSPPVKALNPLPPYGVLPIARTRTETRPAYMNTRASDLPRSHAPR